MISYTAEKALKDNEAKIPAELKDSVNAKITALRGMKDSTDLEAIKKRLKNFQLKCLRLVKR